MKKIGIVAAMEPEIDLLRNELDDAIEEMKYGIKFYNGVINDMEVSMALCGVGKVNSSMATLILINDYECNFIINTGIAGGISPLNTEDVFIANELMYHDFDTTVFGYSYGQVPGLPATFKPSIESIVFIKSILNKLNINYKEGIIYSGDKFVSSLDVLNNVKLKEYTACEMEGASIAQVCVKANVEFVILRYISDIIGSDNQVSNYLEFEQKMAERSSKICLQILNNL